MRRVGSPGARVTLPAACSRQRRLRCKRAGFPRWPTASDPAPRPPSYQATDHGGRCLARRPTTPTGAMLRSFLLPAGGGPPNGRKVTGGIMMGVEELSFQGTPQDLRRDGPDRHRATLAPPPGQTTGTGGLACDLLVFNHLMSGLEGVRPPSRLYDFPGDLEMRALPAGGVRVGVSCAEATMSQTGPIGIFDSGIRGLTVTGAILHTLPGESTIYFGDTARALRAEVRDRPPLLARDPPLAGRAGGEARHGRAQHQHRPRPPGAAMESPVPIGVIEPGARAAVRASTTGRIGVIGTAGPSRAAPTARHPGAPRRRDGRGAGLSLFVPFVEEGWFDHPADRAGGREYLAPFCRRPDRRARPRLHPLPSPQALSWPGCRAGTVALIDRQRGRGPHGAVEATLVGQGIDQPIGGVVTHCFAGQRRPHPLHGGGVALPGRATLRRRGRLGRVRRLVHHDRCSIIGSGPSSRRSPTPFPTQGDPDRPGVREVRGGEGHRGRSGRDDPRGLRPGGSTTTVSRAGGGTR